MRKQNFQTAVLRLDVKTWEPVLHAQIRKNAVAVFVCLRALVAILG